MISEQAILNASILIVDDEQIFVHLLEETLRAAGYTCIASTMNPYEVCELHCKNRYDLILLDLLMPDMDGFQVLEGLKAIETDGYLPVLVITAQLDHKLRALVAGAKDFVTKPFDLFEVLTRIKNMLEVRLLYKKLGNHNKALEQRALERSAELRETGTLLRRNQTLMQNSMDGIHVMDMQGNIVEANDAFCHMLGYTRAEIAGLNVADWDAQWSAEELKERFKSHINKSARFETVHRRRDGSLLDVEISTSCMQVEQQYFVFATSRDISERKRADGVLKLNKTIIENAYDGFWMFDTNGYLLDVNQAYADMVGFTHEELVGMHISRISVQSNTPELVGERIWRAISQGSGHFETQHFHKDGHIMDFDASIAYIPEAKCLFSFIRDVTERKKTEAVLRRHTLVIDTLIDGFWMTDLQGNLLEANQAYAKISGYPVDALMNMHISQLEAIEQSPEDVQAHIAIVLEQGFDRFETRHRHKDGHEIDIEVSVTHMAEIQRNFVFCLDITERKQADTALRESQQKLKLFIEGAPTGIAAFDTEMRYLAVSEYFMKQFRVVDTDVIGRSHYEIFPEIQEHWRDIHRRCLAGETLGCDKDPFHRADGSVDWVRWEIRPWRDISGKIGGVICFTDDVTESMRVEQELIVLNNYLTHEVSNRTDDLSALTAHIQKIAETEKASLARELHDELGSTLVGISMELGRLRGKISAPDHLQDLSIIKDLVSHASQIIRGVINQLHPSVLDDYGYVAAVEWLVSEYRKHSGIAVELILSKEEVVMEHTFSLAAYRITQECLTNIAKHAGASQVHIKIKASDGLLDLTIHDNGKGLSGGTNSGGHGIFGMIERARFLGGSMEIGSEDGKGTTARLRIPMAIAKPKNKKRVLVVDDHSIIRDALRQLLNDQTDDFSVEGEAADGMAAIQMAIEGEWDIMLLDINLPIKSGLKVLEEIRAVKSCLPIIMLSSHAEEQYGEIALSKGATCYIEKGETSKLVDAMRRATLLQ